jgi:hypothetical protein
LPRGVKIRKINDLKGLGEHVGLPQIVVTKPKNVAISMFRAMGSGWSGLASGRCLVALAPGTHQRRLCVPLRAYDGVAGLAIFQMGIMILLPWVYQLGYTWAETEKASH